VTTSLAVSDLSEKHIAEGASALNCLQPVYISALTVCDCAVTWLYVDDHACTHQLDNRQLVHLYCQAALTAGSFIFTLLALDGATHDDREAMAAHWRCAPSHGSASASGSSAAGRAAAAAAGPPVCF
jgi:hypothetical protein